MGDGWWPLFWAAAALMITGMAAWGSTMLMRLIDQRIESGLQRVLGEMDVMEERLARVEQLLLPPGADRPDELSDNLAVSADTPTPPEVRPVKT
jgi:hypothetical protein